MAKKYSNAVQIVAEFYIKKFKENEEKGYRGLGLVYSGLWELAKKYCGISNPELLLQELNKELEGKGYRIVGDKKARLKMVKLRESDRVKKELEEEFETFMRNLK